LNCNRARELLANYRDIQKERAAILPELDAHLEACSACRQIQQQSDFIGASVRSLPTLSPAPEAHAKLMRALAAEHTRYIQRATSSELSTPTPAFLKPYLKDIVAEEKHLEPLTTFSSAETGPLPVIPITRKRPRLARMGPTTIVGIAAAVLMLIMAGGISSLVLMAQMNSGKPGETITGPAIVNKVTNISVASVAVQTPYPHVVSALADRNTMYFSAYQDGSDPTWMLEQVHLNTNNDPSITPVPLLDKPTTSNIYLLENVQNWLIWLQLDKPKTTTGKPLDTQNSSLTRTWSLDALYVGSGDTKASKNNLPDEKNEASANQPITLLKGLYDQNTVPAWVNSPLQGTSTYQNNLLVSWLDNQGTSHLTRYQLDAQQAPTSEELAHVNAGHVLASPTASSDGRSIYWGEEWATNDNVLHGNIWQSQEEEAAPEHGRWAPHIETVRSLFKNDEASFHPHVVGDTLFMLSTLPLDASNQTNKPSPIITTDAQTPVASLTPSAAKSTPILTPSVTTGQDETPITQPTQAPLISKSDPNAYPLQADAMVQGTLFGYQLSDTTLVPQQFGDEGQSMALQGGNRFLLWQNKNKSINMFDVLTNNPVGVGTQIPANTLFLSIHGDTAVWLIPPDSNANTTQPANTVTFKTFNWPAKIVSPNN
jgi:hypothetical protein